MSFLTSSNARRLSRIALLSLVSLGLATAQPMGALNPNRSGQVWGTYAWKTPGLSGVLPGLLTLTADGAVIFTEGAMFRGFLFTTNPPTEIRLSPLHGSWVRSGGRSINGTSLYLMFGADGTRLAWGRARTSLEFATHYNSLAGKLYVDYLPCPTPSSCPDPTSATAAWVTLPGTNPAGFDVTANRVEVVPAGPLP